MRGNSSFWVSRDTKSNIKKSVKTFSVVDSSSNIRPMLRLALPALAEEFLVLMVDV
jgi:hypothetical protein